MRNEAVSCYTQLPFLPPPLAALIWVQLGSEERPSILTETCSARRNSVTALQRYSAQRYSAQRYSAQRYSVTAPSVTANDLVLKKSLLTVSEPTIHCCHGNGRFRPSDFSLILSLIATGLVM